MIAGYRLCFLSSAPTRAAAGLARQDTLNESRMPMKLPTLLLLFVFTLIAAFAALNWNVFMAPTELSLGYTSMQMPLGLVMLGLLVFMTALFLMFAVYMQTTMLLESRRYAKELQANRELADKAEASRFTELRAVLETEFKEQAQRASDAHAGLLARIEQLERGLREQVEQSGNTLAAYIGELEDRLEKRGTPPAGG